MTITKIGNKALIATPTGVKLGSKGRVMSTSAALADVPKSERRKIRKALRAAGYVKHAGS